MVKKRVQLPVDVVEMARRRIVNVFSNGTRVYLSMSGGKDSIVLAHLIYTLIRERRIDPSQLVVVFVDEEAIYSEVERITLDWRRRFLNVGATFEWYAVEVRHFNCFNMLSNDESFICWDRTRRDSWIRPRPSFAITSHPDLRPRRDNYQTWLPKRCRDGLMVTGVRVAESLQRLNAYTDPTTRHNFFQPIYDWRDTDVWRYIRDHGLDFPETYLHLYQTGSSKREMRISQFFSIDTARSLVKMSEYEPDLMERITAREPNAYLAALYWDTEMFRSAGADRRKNRNATEAAEHEDAVVEEQTDYHAATVALLQSPEYGPHAPNSVKRRNARAIRLFMMRYSVWIEEDDWRSFYSLLVGGDPKDRTRRALYTLLTGRKMRAYEREERDRERAAAATVATAATDTPSTDDTTTEGPTDE